MSMDLQRMSLLVDMGRDNGQLPLRVVSCEKEDTFILPL